MNLVRNNITCHLSWWRIWLRAEPLCIFCNYSKQLIGHVALTSLVIQ